jgi:hypothetical protein
MAKSKLAGMLETVNRRLSSKDLSQSRRKKLLKMRAKLRKDVGLSGGSFVSGGLPSLGKRR